MKGIVLVLSFCAPYLAIGQTITTIAGNGSASYTGDGGAAISASIGGVGGIECDNQGNIYISSFNNTIRKISNTGTITTIAGTGIAGYSGDGGLATASQLYSLGSWMSIDESGDIYVADFNNQRIRKISGATGFIATIAGNGTAGFSGDGGPAIDASFNSPSYVSIDHYGNIYISDYSNFRIRKIDTAGNISTIAGTGTAGYSGDGGAATSAQLFGTLGMCNDRKGNLFFSDNNRIRKIDVSTGFISTVAGNGVSSFSGDGGLAITAGLNAPKDVAIDAIGNLYISDRINHRVRVIDTFGIINTVVGNGVGAFSGDGGSAFVAQIYNSQGITIDACGNLLIADNGNYRIRKVTMPPVLTIPVISVAVPGESAPIPMGTTVTVTATVSSAGSSYLIRWMNRGIEFATTTVPTVTYTKGPGTDTITARVVSTASYGCYDSTTSAPHYVHEGTVGVAYTPATATSLRLYPNPVHTQLTISTTAPITSLCITNVLGQVVTAPPFLPQVEVTAPPGLPQGEVTVPVGHLPKGVYMVRVNGVYVQRFVKE